MTDEHQHRPRQRRHEISEQPTEQLDLDRLRYFTQPADGKPSTRHRRRRAVESDEPEVTQAAHPSNPPAGAQPPPPGAPPMPSAPMPSGPMPSAPPAPSPPPPAAPRTAAPRTGAQRVAPEVRRRAPSAPPPPSRPERSRPERIPPERIPSERIPSDDVDPDQPLTLSSGEYSDPLRSAVPHRVRPQTIEPQAPRTHFLDSDDDPLDETADDVADRGRRRLRRERGAGRPKGRRPRREKVGSPNRTRRRVILALVMACMLVLVAGVGFVGLRSLGVFENHKDYSDAAGTADVIVDIPQNSTLMDFGRILEKDDVVGSVNAFLDAAGGQAMSGGYYKLRTQIPAATAVAMMTDDNEHRVGRVVVPEGLQLDNKKGVDGKTTPGIFQMISDATAVTVNGQRVGADVGQLEKAAAESTPDQLGVPAWARPTVEQLTGDHRRIEGLIAPGTWETIDPNHSATQILHDLIVASSIRFQQWGLLETQDSGLTPYETLVAASVVEREVTDPEDFPKVSRVILNRLAKDQRLEMDSTTNYTANVTNIDVYGDAYKADNKWNTYRNTGLPVTPIGAVGERALGAVEHPTAGNWLYFVTVDRQGTTLFANTFEEHQQNREKACENKLLSTGCS
ncbi:endolytic transglycosylase MltG [Gordonia sp. SL306]|uniref:endolytic transglycosylase MltG n=1 Tax=Gordonia sp. SL306 TaxID=2995145 RepID=UPI0022705CC1|nr:endolytic transglycosylase MltG [Gordonia sp. SL306]WAC55299.1 endolytic transglycosylase MltG [Gordonia sp. SL306]